MADDLVKVRVLSVCHQSISRSGFFRVRALWVCASMHRVSAYVADVYFLRTHC